MQIEVRWQTRNFRFCRYLDNILSIIIIKTVFFKKDHWLQDHWSFTGNVPAYTENWNQTSNQESIKQIKKTLNKGVIRGHVRIRGLEMLVFWEVLRTYLMHDPKATNHESIKRMFASLI